MRSANGGPREGTYVGTVRLLLSELPEGCLAESVLKGNGQLVQVNLSKSLRQTEKTVETVVDQSSVSCAPRR